MHLLISMSPQSHLRLRLAAVALLALAAMWPRAAQVGTRSAVTAANVVHGTSDARTSAARLVSTPRLGKVVVAQADESQLTN